MFVHIQRCIYVRPSLCLPLSSCKRGQAFIRVTNTNTKTLHKRKLNLIGHYSHQHVPYYINIWHYNKMTIAISLIRNTRIPQNKWRSFATQKRTILSALTIILNQWIRSSEWKEVERKFTVFPFYPNNETIRTRVRYSMIYKVMQAGL